MRNIIVALCFFTLLGFAFALFIPYERVFIGDGHYDLTIRLRPAEGVRLKAVTCQAFAELASAEVEANSFLPPDSFHQGVWLKSDPYAGEDLKLSIPFTDRVRIPFFGEPYLESDWQFTGLMVIADFESGKRVRKAIEIPHRNDSWLIEVGLP